MIDIDYNGESPNGCNGCHLIDWKQGQFICMAFNKKLEAELNDYGTTYRLPECLSAEVVDKPRERSGNRLPTALG